MLTPARIKAPAMRVTPFNNAQDRFRAGRLGVGLFLVSLGMLFASSVVGYAIIRAQLGDVWPADLPPLPRLLWLSTITIILSSGTMHWALHSVRQDRLRRFQTAIIITAYLGVAFLLMQTWSWLEWLEPISQRWGDSEGYRFALASFYILTGLHALHVLGGLAPLIVVARRGMIGAYDSMNYAGVHLCAMYWHFLGAVWVILYAILLSGI